MCGGEAGRVWYGWSIDYKMGKAGQRLRWRGQPRGLTLGKMEENRLDKQERSQMRALLHAHPDGPMEYQADDLVPHYVLCT